MAVAAEKEVFLGTLPSGTIVNWHPQGSLSTPPVIAIITKSSKGGVCDLMVVRGGLLEPKRSVYHSSSRYLKDEFGAVNSNAIRNGCWDFTPQASDARHIYGEGKSIVGLLQSLEEKVDSADGGNTTALEKKISALESKIAALEKKLSSK